MRRRDFLASGAVGAAALAFGPAFLRDALAAPAQAGPGPYGALGDPDALGLMLPDGFTAQQIARGGQPVSGTSYPWHFAPDGQATYRTLDGGYILVSNSEAPNALGGGASAIRFDADANVVSAQRILAGTNLNCAGGPTPWGTWLSCEEHEGGMAWECDPAGVFPAVPRPALGSFSHEAAAVDPQRGHVYLTEDQPDSGFYRFTPDDYPDLSSGVLEVAVVDGGGAVTWKRISDPNVVTGGRMTRKQVPDMTQFRGGEGLWHDKGIFYFTTKGDKKVWAYDAATETLDTLFDRATASDSALDAVDNVTVSPSGDVYVCEDGGNMEIGLITPDRVVSAFCRFTGDDHEASEMCGVVFDPSGTRMYFSSQRAYPYVPGTPAADGAVYEVTGPFRLPAEGVPDSWVFGPPAGELGEMPGLPAARGAVTGESSGLRVRAARNVRGSSLVTRGLRVTVRLDRPAVIHLALRTADLATERRADGTHDRPRSVTIARSRQRLAAGRHELTLALSPRAAARVTGRALEANLIASARSGTQRLAATQAIRVRR